MNEDLTKESSALAYEARQLKRQGLIADTFTRDGRILVKRFANQRPKVIRDMDELQSIVRAETTIRSPQDSPCQLQHLEQELLPQRRTRSLPLTEVPLPTKVIQPLRHPLVPRLPWQRALSWPEVPAPSKWHAAPSSWGHSCSPSYLNTKWQPGSPRWKRRPRCHLNVDFRPATSCSTGITNKQ